MTDVEAMTVGETSNHLTENADSFMLRETAVRRYVMEEFSAFYVLEYKIPEFILLIPATVMRV